MSKKKEDTIVNLYDSIAMKNAVDEQVKELFENKKFKEDNTLSNIKIFFSFFVCLFGVVSFFQQEKLNVILCVIGYIIFYLLSGWIIHYVEQSTLILTQPNKSIQQRSILVRTNLKKRYSEEYEIDFVVFPQTTGIMEKYSLKPVPKKTKTFSEVWKLTEIFQEDGKLNQEALKAKFLHLYDQIL